MKNLNHIFAIILVFALLGGCFSVSAWDEPLGEDEGGAPGEIYIDTQPEPQPVPVEYDEAGYTKAYYDASADEIYFDTQPEPLPVPVEYVEAECSWEELMWEPVEPEQESEEPVQEPEELAWEPEVPVWEPEEPVYEPEHSRPEMVASVPRIIGQPVVVCGADSHTEGSTYYVYLRTSAGTKNVSVSYIDHRNGLQHAKIFDTQYICDWNAPGGSYDWCLPYPFKSVNDKGEYFRTALVRASYDGDNWCDPVESGSFLVKPSEEIAITLDVPYYKQNDPDWKNVVISTRTLGAVGCTTSCVAMVYSYQQGEEIDPGEMRDLLTYSGNNITWDSVEKMLGVSVYSCEWKKINTNTLQVILDQLQKGKPVILGGTATANSSNNQHWVVVNGYLGNPASLKAEDFTVLDPGNKSRKNLASFLTYKPYLYKMVY